MRFAGEREKRIEVEVGFEVGGEPVESGVDFRFVGERAGLLCPEAGEEGGAEAVGGEEAVEVRADDAAVDAPCPFRPVADAGPAKNGTKPRFRSSHW